MVAGGTAREERDLCEEIVLNPDLKEVFRKIISWPFGPWGNAAIEKLLLETMNIEAHIDTGIAGTAQMSSPNTYTDLNTGKSMTHAEVIKRIQQYEA